MATDLGPAAPAISSESVTRARWQPTPATFIWLFALVWGLWIGLKPLDDNSLFTHVATGRIIFQSGFPHADPYLFTPHEPSWVVQSWLASVVYWTIVRTWAFAGLLTLTAALTAVLALLVVRLARPADGFIARALLVLVTLAVGAGAWAERPFMFGLIFLSITLIAADDGLDPRWLVPVMYLWVNMHGSFPLGLLALVLLWVGRRLDHEDGTTEWRCLKWAALGTALSVLNPYGPKLLVFPLFLLHRSDVLRHIIEWQAPTLQLGVGEVLPRPDRPRDPRAREAAELAPRAAVRGLRARGALQLSQPPRGEPRAHCDDGTGAEGNRRAEGRRPARPRGRSRGRAPSRSPRSAVLTVVSADPEACRCS